MIDLHLHTTASDGLLSPDALVERLAQAGIETCSVTDHDTVAGLAPAAAAAARHGLRLLPGIEITAVEDGGDVHMLGYGFDPASPRLAEFLHAQRADRRARAHRILEALAALGMPLDPVAVFGTSPAEGDAEADAEGEAEDAGGRSIGRPQIARALVAAGYVASVSDAFDVWLGRDRPAYRPRTGASAAAVIDLLHDVGGIASMAHPGVTKRDALIPALAAHGLDAIEVWHSDHDDVTTARCLAQATALGLQTTGGSDYHGDQPGRNARLGSVGVPAAAFDRLLEYMRARGAAAIPEHARG